MITLNIESIGVIERRPGLSNVQWVIDSMRYLRFGDYWNASKQIYKDGKIPRLRPDVIDNITKNNDSRISDVVIGIILMMNDHTLEDINELLSNPDTKDYGIALSIIHGKLNNVLRFGTPEDLFIYLTEHNITDAEISELSQKEILEKIAKRVIDKKQVMFNVLVDNFQKLVAVNDFGCITKDFLRKYIEHASLSSVYPNSFCEFLLKRFPSVHPDFSAMYVLNWDPYTRARTYGHWLTVSGKMNDISRYYLTINGAPEKNRKFIENYSDFKREYPSFFDHEM